METCATCGREIKFVSFGQWEHADGKTYRHIIPMPTGDGSALRRHGRLRLRRSGIIGSLGVMPRFTRPYDLTKLEAEMLLAPDSIERTVALLAIHELKQARIVLKAMRAAHADVQFDTPEDTAVQAKAVALADGILSRAD